MYSQTGPTPYDPSLTMSGNHQAAQNSSGNLLVQPSGKYQIIDETNSRYIQPDTRPVNTFSHAIILDGDRQYFRSVG